MILVAGGTGRLGSVIVDRLVHSGVDVRVLTRDPQRAAQAASDGVDVVVGDVRDRADVARATRDVDVVVSAIQGFTGPRGISPATIDRDGNANLVDAAAASGATLVLMSVVGASADSRIELFRMKHAAEQYAAEAGTPTTIVRATAFLELWTQLLERTAARSGRPLVFGRGDNPINFVSVIDVAALVERTITDSTARGAVFEIGGPENFTFNELARHVQSAAGRPGAPRNVSRVALRAMAATLGLLKPELGRQARAALVMDTADFTFDAAPIRTARPELPITSLADVLGASRVE